MSKNQSVKVGIRIRPLNKREREMNSPICVSNQQNVLNIQKEKDIKEFVFDYVYGIESRQETIYETCAYSIIENALDGYNGTIFAYGQTGAGKTFTMVGDYKDPEIKGIIPRAFDHVIQAIQTSEEKKFVVRASFIEIYNEDIMDLMEDKSAKNSNAKKQLKENPGKGVYIKDLRMVPVKSVDEMFKILDLGNKNRTVHATAMNAVSSRSHAIFTVHVESLEGADKVKASKLNLVDLAGSERQSKTQATGDRLKEGAKINLSLTALGNVINSLVDGKKGGHIPYRDSKLTRLLQDSLGGNTKTLMIASISPAADNYDETVSTLRYAARARNIKNTPKVNEDPKDAMIRQYMQEIEKLKQQLAGQGGSFEYSSDLSTGISQEEHDREIKKALEEADEKTKELIKKDEEMREMREKLKEMEELVLKKADVAPEVAKARKIKKKKIQKQEELIQKRLEEIVDQDDKLMNEERQKQDDENADSKSPEQKADYWKKLAMELRQKLKMAIKDKEDLQKQFEVEREDLNLSIRLLEGELSFFRKLADKFLSEDQITVLKENSTYDEEKREYGLPPFLMRENSISLPKTLKVSEVEDLWKEKRKNYTFEVFKTLPQMQAKNAELNSPKKTSYKEAKGNPFLQNRRIFKIDFDDPMYQEKEYDPNARTDMFRRTNFRINDRNSQSRSNSRSGSKRLQPINYRPTSSKGEESKDSPLMERRKLGPIKKE